MASFKELKLSPKIESTLEESGYSNPTPVQARVIPSILDHRNVMVSAQTGTGKTAAFALPILHLLHEESWKRQPNFVRSLIVTPTRELALQVSQSFERYGKELRFTPLTVYGGVSIVPQKKKLRQGIDVLVATPGRLLDLHNQGAIDFSELKYFVLDEVDRMLDMGFLPDVKRILKVLPKEKQSLFFTATLSNSVQDLAEQILKDPLKIIISPEKTTAEKVDHRICFLHQSDKQDLLMELLKAYKAPFKNQLKLIFTRTRIRAERLSQFLENKGFRVESIHGNKTQSARLKALEKFKQGKVEIMVATDVASRGIDIKDIRLVINYDIPEEPESYVHRIGRTARAGASGLAFTFCTPKEKKELREICKCLNGSIPIHREHSLHDENNVLPMTSSKKTQSNPKNAKPKKNKKKRLHPRDFKTRDSKSDRPHKEKSSESFKKKSSVSKKVSSRKKASLVRRKKKVEKSGESQEPNKKKFFESGDWSPKANKKKKHKAKAKRD